MKRKRQRTGKSTVLHHLTAGKMYLIQIMLLLGAFAGMIADTITHPIDTLNTRLKVRRLLLFFYIYIGSDFDNEK